MASQKKIKGTRHIKRKMTRRNKGIVGALAAAIIGVGLWGLSAKGVINMSKIPVVNNILNTVTTSVSLEEAGFILGGEADAGSMIMVRPVSTTGGRVVGTGTLDISNKNSLPGEAGSTYLELGAMSEDKSMFLYWEIDGVKLSSLKANPLRIYYYDNPSMTGIYEGEGFSAYITNKSIEVRPVFQLLSGAAGPSNGDATITVITAPNVGKQIVTLGGSRDYVTINGYQQITYSNPGDTTVRTRMETTAGENRLFRDKDNPRYAWYVYNSSGQLREGKAEAQGNDLFNKDGSTDRTYRDGDILIINPHLISGATDQAVGIAEPQAGGVVTWTGNQLIATPNSKYKFDHWEWFENSDKRSSTENPLFAKPSGIVIYKAFFVEAKYKVSLAQVNPINSCSVSGLDLYNEHANAKIIVTPKSGYKFKNATWTTENGIPHNASPSIDGGGVATFTVSDITEDIFLNIEMESDQFTINVDESPSGMGDVSVKNITTGGAVSHQEKFNPGEKAELLATPASGNVFLYWEDSKGNRYQNDKLTIEGVYGSETFVAHFSKSAINFTLDSGGGTVTVDYLDENGKAQSKTVSGVTPETWTIKPNTGVTIKSTGVPAAGQSFSFFTKDGETTLYKDNPLYVNNIIVDTKYTAHYTANDCTITMKASPSDAGTAFYKVTGDIAQTVSGTVSYGTEITLGATPATNDKFLYFMDAKGNIIKNTTFNVYGTEEFTAVFAPANVKVITKSNKGTVTASYIDKDGNYQVETTSDNTSTPYEVQGGSSLTLTVTPEPGYVLTRFDVTPTSGTTTQQPVLSGSNSYTFTNVKTDTTYEAVFEERRCNITVNKSPIGAYNVYVNGDEGNKIVGVGTKVILTTDPDNEQYRFLYYKDENGNKYYGTGTNNEYTFTALGDQVLTACFAKKKNEVHASLFPSADAGAVEITYTSESSGSKMVTDDVDIYDVKGDTDVSIRAIEKNGYQFVQFIDNDGKAHTENPLVLPKVSGNKNITVVFAPEQANINTAAVPEVGGSITVNGKGGSQKVNYGENVIIEATPNSGYSVRYFEDQNGNQFVGTDLSDGKKKLEFKAVNGHETYKVYFIKNETSITIDLTPSGAGTVRLNDETAVSSRKTYTVDGRSNIRITATPKEEYEFVCFRDQDGKTYPDNPLTIVDVSKDLTFTAVFDSKITGIRAVASPASGGRISKIINDDGSIKLIASANKGYKFVNWRKGDRVLTMGPTYVVVATDVKDGDTYTAYFKEDSSYDPKSDITKEHFYREWRKVITPSYTVTRDSMKLLAMVSVAGLHQYDDATPPLRSYQAIANAEAYFDEKVAKDAARLDGIFGDSELMTAEGEILTPDLIPDFIEYEKLAREFTYNKFGDLYDTEILTVKRVVEPDGFNNIDRTYLWRYTGAEYYDNIYLLYNVNGQDHEWATPIVDEDGVLKFTIDTLKDGDIVAVVRVKIK